MALPVRPFWPGDDGEFVPIDNIVEHMNHAFVDRDHDDAFRRNAIADRPAWNKLHNQITQSLRATFANFMSDPLCQPDNRNFIEADWWLGVNHVNLPGQAVVQNRHDRRNIIECLFSACSQEPGLGNSVAWTISPAPGVHFPQSSDDLYARDQQTMYRKGNVTSVSNFPRRGDSNPGDQVWTMHPDVADAHFGRDVLAANSFQFAEMRGLYYFTRWLTAAQAQNRLLNGTLLYFQQVNVLRILSPCIISALEELNNNQIQLTHLLLGYCPHCRYGPRFKHSNSVQAVQRALYLTHWKTLAFRTLDRPPLAKQVDFYPTDKPCQMCTAYAQRRR